MHGIAGDTAEVVGGTSDSSFSKLGSATWSIITAPYNVVHGAYDEVKGAASRAADLVKSAQAATSQAATGFASWTKWVVVGLLAVAVIYVLSFVPRGRQ